MRNAALGMIFFSINAFAAQPVIVASNSILASMAQDLLGDLAEVKSLTRVDVDPHMFELKPRDFLALEKSDLIFINGEGMESWESQALKKKKWQNKLVRATEGLPLLEIKAHGTDTDRIKDPHFWHDPRLAILALKNLAERMGTLKPELKPKLKKNLESTTESYSATHKECEKLLKNLRSRTAVSSHDAFGYFENAYNITILAPHGWSTDTEPQPQNVTKIKTWLETKKAGALFLENGVDSPLVQKLSKESGVKIGGNLYADTLTAAEGQAPTYRKMLGWNCKAVSEALR